jgi:hypothetical protein
MANIDYDEMQRFIDQNRPAPEPEKPKATNKGGRPKRQTTVLGDLNLSERLSRAQAKLEAIIDNDDASGGQRLG